MVVFLHCLNKNSYAQNNIKHYIFKYFTSESLGMLDKTVWKEKTEAETEKVEIACQN